MCFALVLADERVGGGGGWKGAISESLLGALKTHLGEPVETVLLDSMQISGEPQYHIFKEIHHDELLESARPMSDESLIYI